jgi:hypothetical protein
MGECTTNMVTSSFSSKPLGTTKVIIVVAGIVD